MWWLECPWCPFWLPRKFLLNMMPLVFPRCFYDAVVVGFWFCFMLTFLYVCNFLTIYHLWCCLLVFLLLIKLRLSPNQNVPSIWIFTKKKVQIWTFGRLTPHLGMSFQDNGLATLLLNNHHGSKTHKTLEMLNLFGLKILFSMKIKFNFIEI